MERVYAPVFRQHVDDGLPKVGARALMSLVYYHEVPIGLQQVLLQLLVVVATHKRRAAQVLH